VGRRVREASTCGSPVTIGGTSIVPRDAVDEVREPYVAEVFDRDYRRVDGYSLKVKLKDARELAAKNASR